jgi:hypothetical protein
VPGVKLVDTSPVGPVSSWRAREGGGDAEIRLTYRELSALIEEAVRALA